MRKRFRFRPVAKGPRRPASTASIQNGATTAIAASTLPILAHSEEITRAVRERQAVVVVGETGSGKTTQLPRFLYEEGIAADGIIGVTEPRRIAATSVARFVAGELGSEVGEIVGYQVRFDDRTADDTAIKFMTDGILLREIQADPDLRKYSIIMVDEAHERSANIDFLLGLLKDLLRRRSDLKVVVSSATIDANKFSQYFDGAPVIEVSGRTFPVDVVWGDENHTDKTVVNAVVSKVAEIHENESDGDVLVFMPGAQEINFVIKGIRARGFRDVVALPAHGGLSPEDQQKIFTRFPGKRKVVVATNIAETSITVDGVVYVVDSGLVKQTHFHPESGIQSLDVVRHSKAGCAQRAGRAGRTRPGVCYRLFTEKDFKTRPDFTEPEIRRMSLAGVVLAMEAIGIANAENFDFIDPPDAEAFREAYDTLIALGAIERVNKGLTDIGRQMARLPLDPRTARMVLEAEKHGCVSDAATVAAFLSVRSVFPRPEGKEHEADSAHMQFKDERSDALTFLRVWRAYEASGFDKDWCYECFLHSRSLWEAKNIREQLFFILEQNGMNVSDSGNDEVLMKSVAAGLVYNLFERDTQHAYTGRLRDLCGVFIHPGSSAFGFSSPKWMVAAEVVETSERFARNVSGVNVEWLPELAPGHFWFGPMRLVSYTEEEDTVIACQPILSRSRAAYGPEEATVGTREVRVSLNEAQEIQTQSVAEARRRGWRPLVFEKVPGRILDDLKAVDKNNGVSYRCASLPTIRPEPGMVYYCEVRLKSYGMQGMEADPQFRLLTFVSPGEDVTGNNWDMETMAFVEAKARHFQCTGCGAMERVSRREFQRYTRGEPLELKCIGCGASAVVTKKK